jgi:cytochrome c oxidase assembly protein subunit 15
MTIPEAQQGADRCGWLGPSLVAGFAGALAVWCAWFAAPLPWVALGDNIAIGIAAVAWLVVTTICLRLGKPGISTGIGAGLITAAVCLIPLLSMLRPSGPGRAPLEHPLPTDAWKIVLLFFGAGAAIGLLATGLARASSSATPHRADEARWLPRFATVAAVAVAPLLFFGGLVTSTNSGMAVPDWPTTFGAQMFFYPMGRDTRPDVYLEHTHRLFGTLVGLSSLVLMIWTLRRRGWSWVGKLAVIAFVLVCLQGVLGGGRVWLETHLAGEDPLAAARVGRRLAFFHGILAQLVFGFIVGLAAYLSPAYAEVPQNVDAKAARRIKKLATALLHTLILQLLLGAMARHFRTTNHALWLHAAFSIIVVGEAMSVGFAARVLTGSGGGVVALRRTGLALIVVSLLQFALGWAAFLVRGQDIKAETIHEALIRTAHQANGALVLAATALAFVWARWLWRSVRPG